MIMWSPEEGLEHTTNKAACPAILTLISLDPHSSIPDSGSDSKKPDAATVPLKIIELLPPLKYPTAKNGDVSVLVDVIGPLRSSRSAPADEFIIPCGLLNQIA